MAGPVQVEPADIDNLADFIQESGEPQSLEELALRYIERVRQRAIAELAT